MKNKKALLVIVLLLAIFLTLAVLSKHPVLVGGNVLTETQRDAVLDQAKGVYSSKLPLVPVYVRIDSAAEEELCYTIYYFPFGTVEMRYGDGYAIEKPLAGR